MFKNLSAIILLCVLGACAEASTVVKRPVESKFLPGSVVLYITRSSGEFMCSGVLVTANTIATARHCTREAERIVVYEPTTTTFAFAAHIVEDPEQDRAEILTATMFDTHATMGQTLDTRPVRLQGFGCSDGSKLEQRTALFYRAEAGPARAVMWAGRACPGDSGAGIWTADGRLAAIVTDTGYVTDHGRRINALWGALL